ncbi:MAG: hypothetical protein AAGD25_06480 [Cyanobacteria bacterium P01_F01_bin.150]
MNKDTQIAVSIDVQELLDSWIEAHEAGEKFPVPFEQAFPMAGYKNKRTAKAKLPKRLLGELFAVSLQKSTGGRPSELIKLSIDGLKHLCLMADTEEGHAIRQYFIECENRLKELQASEEISLQLPSKEDKLNLIERGMGLLERLGGMDDRTKLMLQDQVRDVLMQDKLQRPALPSNNDRLEWPISDRARELGYRPSKSELQRIGKIAAAVYRDRHGYNPPKREQFVDGTTRKVNCYGRKDLDIVDDAIQLGEALAAHRCFSQLQGSVLGYERIVTNKQVADFFDVPVQSIRQATLRHSIDGIFIAGATMTRKLRSFNPAYVDVNASRLTLWTPKAVASYAVEPNALQKSPVKSAVINSMFEFISA